MASRIKQERQQRVAEVAAALGATVNAIDETNEWEVSVGRERVGFLCYEPSARVWLATAGKETTVGDLVGCLRFVIHRC